MSWKGDLIKGGITSDGRDIEMEKGILTIKGRSADYNGVILKNGDGHSLVGVEKVTLTAAQIKALATPITIITAPGANKLLQFVSAILVLNKGTQVLAENADNLVFIYTGAANCSEVIECTGFIDQTADTITNAIQVKDVIDASADIVNKGIQLKNTNGNFTGNAANDATLDVYMSYRIFNLA